MIHLGEDRLKSINENRKVARARAEINKVKVDKRIEVICPHCLQTFKKFKFEKKIYCSRQCANIELGKLRYHPEKHKKKIKIKYDGPALPDIDTPERKPGFYPRNRMSYAELFWQKVLDNNKILYEHDYQIPTESLHTGGVYRLDFKIGMIDLEIDSSLHDTDYCIEKDIRRDKYLTSLGYSVYRIRWVNPRNDVSKNQVNKQIDDLFEFLGRERIH